ncbi:MAG: hypothetical protein AAGE52_10315 [Myxococcota bacterium]
MLDLLQFDADHAARISELEHPQRVALACWGAEYAVPVYKQFRKTHDWKVVDPVAAAGWTFIEKGNVKLPRKLWDRAGQLTTHYYYEGIPLMLFSVATATSLLRTIEYADERSIKDCARVLKCVAWLAEEVDAVLGGTAAQDETFAWIDARFRQSAEGDLAPSDVDHESGAGLPSWWSDLVAHDAPIQKRKLD